MITRRPITPEMVTVAARVLYEQHRQIEGRVPWEEAVEWVQTPWELKARIALEAAVPQDGAFLHKFADECRAVAEIL